jgi:protein ImuB
MSRHGGTRRRSCRPPGLQDALPLPGHGGAAPRAAAPAATPPRAATAGTGTTPHRRILALHLPWLAVERLRLPPSRPAACWTATGNRRLLTAVTPAAAAAAAGLRAGQPVADAQAILPDLLLRPAEPEADAAWLRDLALWALGLTPLPAVDPPDGLLLDATGLAHLHGGEEAALLRHAVARFALIGVTVRGALAGSAVAAGALARGGIEGIVPPGGEEAAVAPLPLAALRLEEGAVAALHRMGIRRVGDALRLPRGPLARRFGAALVDRLDAAAGRHATPITPLRPPPEFSAARAFPEPILTREAIDATLDVLLRELCARLAEAGRGARRLVLLGFRVDGVVQEVAVGSGLAQRDPAHFARLFREPLERIAPGFGLERLVLEAPVTEALGDAQAALPGRDGVPAAETRRQALAQLLDRLSQRVPVWRLAPRLSHWPERAVAPVGAFDPVPVPAASWPGTAPRPLRLLRRPVPLTALAALPDDPPLLLRTDRGAAWRVRRAEGPERIEPEWWRETRPGRAFRDYYRVELETGARLWVCRSGFTTAAGGLARWWLHGRFG